MSDSFFERPILNSPYAYPGRHWELDAEGQPTDRIIEMRRRSDLVTPVPKSKEQGASQKQRAFVLGGEDAISTETQEYNPTPIINEVRGYVDAWRRLPNPDQWLVTPETARLLQHWRHHPFQGIRPFFCQIEAVETAIWLSARPIMTSTMSFTAGTTATSLRSGTGCTARCTRNTTGS